MSYIFLDESGDLGFDKTKKRSSKYFLITFLFSNDKRPIEKAVKLTYLSLIKTHKQKSDTLHCYREKLITRTRLLTKLSQKNIKIMTVYLNKSKVYTKLRNEKDVLYNFVTNILLDRICTKKLIPIDEKIVLIASRKETNKFLNQNFKNYLCNQAKNNHKIDLKVEIKTPHEEKSLQAVDFLSWSIFRKYEYDDESYYEIFKDKIFKKIYCSNKQNPVRYLRATIPEAHVQGFTCGHLRDLLKYIICGQLKSNSESYKIKKTEYLLAT